jgi:RND superfamily putative drug exporter
VLETDDDAAIRSYAAALRGIDGIGEVKRIKVVEGMTLLQLRIDRAHGGGEQARDVVSEARNLEAPAPVRFGGQAPGEQEMLDTIKDGFPKAAIFVVATTFLVLAYAFRSIALPLKAIIMDMLSIGASMGVVVAIFQLGLFGTGALDVTPLGYIESTSPVILFCVLFGLSMDYEVFMLATVAERYQQGADNTSATAQGVASTAPLVTGAALILIVVGGSFALTELVLVKQVGVGLAVALIIDATIVRCLLVPATMRLLGDANWWMPRSLLARIPRTAWSH